MACYLFPFEKVKQGGKIVLYGAGTVGQQFLHQLVSTGYATVVAMVDKNWENYDGVFPVLIGPESLNKLNFAVAVISVQNQDVAETIARELVQVWRIAPRKIVMGYARKYEIPSLIYPKPKSLDSNALSFQREGYIPIALYMCCGMGDTLVIKRKMEELMGWDSRLLLDVWVPEKLVEAVRSFYRNAFGGRINAIRGEGNLGYEWAKRKYAISLKNAGDLCVDYINEEYFHREGYLLDKFKRFQEERKEYGLFSVTENVLHFRRCEIDGYWAYTSCNRYSGFDVEDYHTDIPMDMNYREKYIALGLEANYITMNFGFDTVAVGRGNLQAKAWPLNYFSQLTRLIKKKWSVQLVQVGGADFPHIDGCDHYYLGKSLELVKYILQGAKLHIDIEGGLVHLATQLGTKCAVMFGPTPMHYYGYRDNINIDAGGKCTNCYWLVPNHYACYRRMEKPECMHDITPQRVIEKIEGWLEINL